MTAHLMCRQCNAVFTSENLDADADNVTCPECGFRGKPAGIMNVSGVPSLEVFKRNYGKANFPKTDKLR